MGPALASHITRLRLELRATCPKIIGLTSSLVKSPIGALDTYAQFPVIDSLTATIAICACGVEPDRRQNFT
jgi:hypothetical protein